MQLIKKAGKLLAIDRSTRYLYPVPQLIGQNTYSRTYTVLRLSLLDHTWAASSQCLLACFGHSFNMLPYHRRILYSHHTKIYINGGRYAGKDA